MEARYLDTRVFVQRRRGTVKCCGGYMEVDTPCDDRCFRINLSVPYQLNPLVEWPILGRWTLAKRTEGEERMVACLNRKIMTPYIRSHHKGLAECLSDTTVIDRSSFLRLSFGIHTQRWEQMLPFFLLATWEIALRDFSREGSRIPDRLLAWSLCCATASASCGEDRERKNNHVIKRIPLNCCVISLPGQTRAWWCWPNIYYWSIRHQLHKPPYLHYCSFIFIFLILYIFYLYFIIYI